MVALVVQFIITMLVCGFVYWVWTLIRPTVASFIAEPFMSLIDKALLVLIAAIVVFWFLIPLVRMIPGAIKF